MNIHSSDTDGVAQIAKRLVLPSAESHKGQNGKLLIIGGSSLFHAASLWAAEMASHFVDMVHYASTKENQAIFLSLKTKFTNGMIIAQKDIEAYIKEDDVVLIGPGMVRGESEEGLYTAFLTRNVLTNFPAKRVVVDAGALQVMDPEWLLGKSVPTILTPHQIEFRTLFGLDVAELSLSEKKESVRKMAQKYRCTIILKAVIDIISDGQDVYTVEGGNAGLTKGGSGDVLAALISGFYVKNDPVVSCVLGSYLLKTAADSLFTKQGYWYNIDDLIKAIPRQASRIAL